MSKPLSPGLLRQLSSEPPFSTPATLPSQPAQSHWANRCSGPSTRAGIQALPDLNGSDTEGLLPCHADTPDADDELGLLPLIDTIMVEAKPDVVDVAPLLVDRLLSTAEAAAFFGREPRTLHRWRQRGLIRAVRVGAALFYVGADIDALMPATRSRGTMRAMWTVFQTRAALDSKPSRRVFTVAHRKKCIP